jgi:hypothetical protein
MKNYTFSIVTIIIATITINLNMSAQKLNNEIDSVSYSLGVNIGENIKTQFPDIDIKNFEAAIKDVLDDSKEPTVSGADAQKKNSRIFFKTTSQSK